jgi:hypothetical protein
VGVEAAEIIHVSTCPRCSMHTVRGKNFDPGQLCIASAISNGELNKIDVNQCTNERLWKLKLASKLLKGGDNDNWKPAPKYRLHRLLFAIICLFTSIFRAWAVMRRPCDDKPRNDFERIEVRSREQRDRQPMARQDR